MTDIYGMSRLARGILIIQFGWFKSNGYVELKLKINLVLWKIMSFIYYKETWIKLKDKVQYLSRVGKLYTNFSEWVSFFAENLSVSLSFNLSVMIVLYCLKICWYLVFKILKF